VLVSAFSANSQPVKSDRHTGANNLPRVTKQMLYYNATMPHIYTGS